MAEIQTIRRIEPVRLEPPLAIVVTLDVEHVRVAIGVGYVQKVVHATTSRILSRLNLIRHHNTLTFCTKYLLF